VHLITAQEVASLNLAEVTKNQLIPELVSFLVDLLVDRFTLFTDYLFDISLLNL
jgi:hypothetical protein